MKKEPQKKFAHFEIKNVMNIPLQKPLERYTSRDEEEDSVEEEVPLIL